MRTESMSKNIVNIISELAKNDGLIRLLANDIEKPLSKPSQIGLSSLVNPKNSESRILPFPFDVDATTEEGSFLRIYYNDGEFDESGVIAESKIHIDIICSRNLWLINDDNSNYSLIRPYEILSRIVSTIGRRSANPIIRLDIQGYQHLYINKKFDAIRLYCEYMSVET